MWVIGKYKQAKELALSQIAEGADFIFHNADAAGQGVFHAVEESRKAGKDIYAYGSNRNQNHIAPDAILASAVIDTKFLFTSQILSKRANLNPRLCGSEWRKMKW